MYFGQSLLNSIIVELYLELYIRNEGCNVCGITGWIDFKREMKNEVNVVKAMADSLAHRGPDAGTTWSGDHVVFGHRRLIVIDPAGGAQPMTRVQNGKEYTLCYNGELYNTDELRSELKNLGYRFESYSDTEVLLMSYIHWQEGCVEKLNGIFSFAIWDSAREMLFMARDRLGVKPLFFYPLENGLLFGSEMKAILAHPLVKTEVDTEGLQELLGLSPSHTPGKGVFKGMKELRPAHWLRMTRNDTEVRRYWQVTSEKHLDSEEETALKVRKLVKDAIERQLVSDLPISTFLSGGVDSSAITAISHAHMQKKHLPTLKTFSFDYEDNAKFFVESDFQPNSDAPWVKRMTNTFQTDHHNAVITQDKLFTLLEDSMRSRDLPGMADIDSSLMWFCGEIRKQATVGLSGECADEIFGGYPWFHREDRLMSDIFPWMTSISGRENLLRPALQKKLHLKEYVKARYEDSLAEVPHLEGESKIEAKRRGMFYVNMIWFMTTLLERKDRMSMAKSLEVRVPFADHHLVEYVWNVPWAMKMLNNREKGLLRKALEGVLPTEILYRKKSPFPKTHHPTYKNLVTQALDGVIKEKDSPLFDILDYQKVKDLVATEGASFTEPYFGQLMTGPQLMAHLLQMDMWLKQYNVKITS